MQFEIVHEFDIPRDALELAVLSPTLAPKLAERLTHIEKLEQTSHSLDMGRLTRVWSCRANIKIPGFAQKYVTPEMCAWEETSVYDIQSHTSEWKIRPNVKLEWQKYFSSHGSYVLLALDSGRTRRLVRGSIDVNVNYVGRVAEKLVFSEVIKKTFDAEAEILRELATLT